MMIDYIDDDENEDTFFERDDNGVQAYLNKISKHELLSTEETLRLAKLIKEHGDKSAIEKLITANLRLVITIATDYRKYWMEDFLDLVQEGNIGLAKAVRKFDPDKNVKFSYYASFWIRAYMMKYTMDTKRLIKIGTTQAQRKLFFSLEKEIRRHELSGIQPDPEEIAKNLQVNIEEVIEMTQRLNGSEISIQTPLNQGDPRCLEDTLSTNERSVEEIVTSIKEKSFVHKIILKNSVLFSDKEKAILDQRLLNVDTRTLKNIADQFDVSKERIRQIEAALIHKLQEIFEHEMPDRVAA